jgi:hypothetical protein
MKFSPDSVIVTNSSFIKQITYYSEPSRLVIGIFNKNESNENKISQYEYHNVPLLIAAKLFNAKSKGKYFNKFIKGKYEEHPLLLLKEK